MTDLERARKVFSGDIFASATTGCVVEAVGDGYARCSLTLQPKHMNSLGMPMGGAVFTLADFTYAVASNFDRDVYISTAANVHFMRSSKGNVLYAEGKQIRCGRRTCLFSVEITDDLGTQVAYMSFSGVKTMERKKK